MIVNKHTSHIFKLTCVSRNYRSFVPASNYSGTSEQQPPSGTAHLAFVERLASLRRFIYYTPGFIVNIFLTMLDD